MRIAETFDAVSQTNSIKGISFEDTLFPPDVDFFPVYNGSDSVNPLNDSKDPFYNFMCPQVEETSSIVSEHMPLGLEAIPNFSSYMDSGIKDPITKTVDSLLDSSATLASGNSDKKSCEISFDNYGTPRRQDSPDVTPPFRPQVSRRNSVNISPTFRLPGSADSSASSVLTDCPTNDVKRRASAAAVEQGTAECACNNLAPNIENKRKFKCCVCGKGFRRPSSLATHSNIHTGFKPYVCPYENCHKSFNAKSNMFRHYKLHFKLPSGAYMLPNGEITTTKPSSKQLLPDDYNELSDC
ncbi:C2H2-type zinc finger protein KNAG_0J02250 [Huiozyma naganishii CBS 8797]|uniref:C2H2-type domain-containing protein n=1 Tax=Huiozyma naganishii (strain ATCC MYA-139 / BCRC 22969 / CBS 8797 / KCTC 17520 / NBRC 10181 / NCYC 3082 / Yp74L-3) TaxID=1071383 RepID=J7SAM6_HUIN7|nr:hypothetical protein KNAG_0J02250 [Kazachstania naganishii CBS 8797]CCK72306.1 hypothetical protein KNAG_0J02250 [Kazachstania naganishii CBS 8797]